MYIKLKIEEGRNFYNKTKSKCVYGGCRIKKKIWQTNIGIVQLLK